MFLANVNLPTILIALLAGSLVGFLLMRRKKYDYSKIIILEASDFKDNMRKGQLIDIRKKEKFEEGKINGARNFPGSSSIGMIRKDIPVFLYDDNDYTQAYRVAKKMIKKEYTTIYILKDGLKNWPYGIKH